jgi:hypothetical protein
MTETKPDLLLEFLLAALAPLLIAGSITDLQAARLAARQAIDAYSARGDAELVTIAQIVGFALTALDALRLSMAADLPLSMKLRLRGNANSLSRSARQHTQMLQKSRSATAESGHSLAKSAAATGRDTPQTPPDEPVPAQTASGPAEATEQQHRRQWADAMKAVAADLRSPAAPVPPAQRYSDRLWVDVLTNLAGELRQPSAHSKADLLRTTVMPAFGSAIA